jgi:1-phosphatidylinositol-4-phosphate 5-kinase
MLCLQIRFVVMGNVFNAEVPIHQKYDLKGSTHGRFTKDKAKSSIWKDCDLDVELQLMDGWKDRLDRQLSEDAAFLRVQHVMDYSLLMGIHYKNREQVWCFDARIDLLALHWHAAFGN